jgi:Zn-dependent oligopeptidase
VISKHRIVTFGLLASVLLAAAFGLSGLPAVTQFLDSPRAVSQRINPLLSASTLSFQAPPFDKIKDSDFVPAFEEAMQEQLAGMLDDDAFGCFEEHGGLTRQNGQRFRDLILSRGNTEHYAKMFRDFRGRDLDISAMLAHRGLK